MSCGLSEAEEYWVGSDLDQVGEAGTTQDGGQATRKGGLYSWIRRKKSAGSRIASGSALYTRVLPVVILAMAILTAVLILFAAGVLLGVVPFR